MNKIITYKITGQIMQTNLFHREQPACQEGSSDQWDIAKEVIDHGCFILVEASKIRKEHAIRDSVTAALLRRALITSEGIRLQLGNGLIENAYVLLRTFQDIEVNLKLVINDKTDNMVKRLAAFQYLKGHHHITKIFSNTDTKNDLHESQDDTEFMRDIGRKMKEYFDMPAFDDIREDVKSNMYWHGMNRVEDAYDAVECTSEYINLYDNFSPFTHASNLDKDFADINNGVPVLKPLFQRDPSYNLFLLHGLLIKLVHIFELYIQDKDNQKYQKDLEVKSLENGECFPTNPLTALNIKIHSIFGNVERNNSSRLL